MYIEDIPPHELIQFLKCIKPIFRDKVLDTARFFARNNPPQALVYLCESENKLREMNNRHSIQKKLNKSLPMKKKKQTVELLWFHICKICQPNDIEV
ncbi:hypothetical protein [Fluoribacter gormanii]|uniref:hypothetical protein n=1 Tax=Fluoribacter gormanii TaxID=464 RepID=UPI0013EFA2F5|nr:hypothetical protein [Fluoribacter gormanii]